MAEDSRPRPAEPDEAGVQERSPDMMQVEAAKLLANDARGRLRDLGFDDEQIDGWARTYVDRFGSGGVDELVGWIEAEERH